MSEGKFGNELHHNHTYKTLRVVAGEEGGCDLRYTVWCGGERELFDLEVMLSFFFLGLVICCCVYRFAT